MLCSAEGNMLTCLRAKTNAKREAQNSRCEESTGTRWWQSACTSTSQRCVRRRGSGTHALQAFLRRTEGPVVAVIDSGNWYLRI